MQPVRRIVGNGDVVPDVEPGKDLEFERLALEAPARQQLDFLLAAGHPGIVERAGLVTIGPTRQQRLQRVAFAPQIGTGKQ
jgi:hypothetical protein